MIDECLGDEIYAEWNGDELNLVNGNSNMGFIINTSVMLALEQFIKKLREGENLLAEKEVDVWHEESKSFYRANLIRKLTLDEIYEIVSKS